MSRFVHDPCANMEGVWFPNHTAAPRQVAIHMFRLHCYVGYFDWQIKKDFNIDFSRTLRFCSIDQLICQTVTAACHPPRTKV